MTKAELRTIYKAERQKLSAEAVELASQQICDQWQKYIARTDIFGKKDQATDKLVSVHIFLPIQSQNEVNTWFVINWLWQTHPAIQLVTSVSNFADGTLMHVALTPATELIINRYGIPEPDPTTSVAVSTSAIDVVLVPLLIFDQQGNRVGYGKGFYDRFLADCRPDCLKVGLSLFEPVEPIKDMTPADIKLTTCLTPNRTVNFFSTLI